MRQLVIGTVVGAMLLTACVDARSVDDAAPSTTATESTTAPSTSATTAPTTAPSTTEPTTTAPSTTAPSPTAAPTTTRPVATTVVPPPGPLFGVAVPEGRIETIENIEREVGQTMHLVRVFTRWEVDLDETDVAEIQAGGRAIHLSVRPLRSNGEAIAWGDIANAPEGSSLYQEMVQWADDVIALGPDARFTFNHEPETSESAANGDALQYREAWRRMVELIRRRGGDDIEMVWTVGASVLADATGRSYYPGDDVVDVIGGDLYNWYTCQGTNRPWVSFEDLLEPAVAFAAERGKPLALPEFASAADPQDAGRRADWLDDAAQVMAEWNPADRRGVELDFVAWFDVTAPGGTNPNCVWSHTSDSPTEQAFFRMARELIGG